MEYLKYYLFNRILNNLDNVIKDKLTYDDNIILTNLAFQSIPFYYSKKDKYGLIEGFKSDKFNDFIVECAISIDKENDFDNLLFVYNLIISNTTSNELLKKELNILDINKYISDNYEIKFDEKFYKENHKKLLNYNEKIDGLVHNPLIKIFDFFGSYYYFLKGYKKYKKEFKKEIKETTDLENKNIEIINNIDDYISYLYMIIENKINAVNNYLFFDNDKEFRKEFNINKEKKI